MTPSYLFYDIETTGLNKAFDQVLQFAAVRTDSQLNETDRHSIRIKLRPDIIPSPRAIITNRISMQELNSGICEFEAIRQIHGLMNDPGTVSLGYNTLGFDDEFLRFSFYRNLLPHVEKLALKRYSCTQCSAEMDTGPIKAAKTVTCEHCDAALRSTVQAR